MHKNHGKKCSISITIKDTSISCGNTSSEYYVHVGGGRELHTIVWLVFLIGMLTELLVLTVHPYINYSFS